MGGLDIVIPSDANQSIETMKAIHKSDKNTANDFEVNLLYLHQYASVRSFVNIGIVGYSLESRALVFYLIRCGYALPSDYTYILMLLGYFFHTIDIDSLFD